MKLIDKIVRTGTNFVARKSRGRIINIDSKKTDVGGQLSNFAKSPFILDGIKWNSFEGFWQGIKFPGNSKERNKARNLYGKEAKQIATGVHNDYFFYFGKKIKYESREAYELAKRAERARFLQNPEQMKFLLSTGNAKFVHFIGIKDSKTLARKNFCKILTELREEFRKKATV